MDSVDYIIVGQGLAGSSLAWQLLKRGASFVVVDDGHTGAASLAAAGIINPITGQRLTSAWQFHRFYSEASTLYRQLESVFGDRYFYEMLVHRFIGTDKEFQLFKSRRKSRHLCNILIPCMSPIRIQESSSIHMEASR